MAVIEVVTAGLLTTIQDLGRPDWQAFGLPVAGAADTFSFRAGNLLVGNRQDFAAVEATFMGPRLRFTEDTLIALTGAPSVIRLDDQPVPMWQSLWVRAGQELDMGTVTAGCRTYLAVAGGIDVPLLMGSRSTYVRGGLGGYKGRKLAVGDKLSLGHEQPDPLQASMHHYAQQDIPLYPSTQTIRVMLGPQTDHFTAISITKFLETPYKVTPEADRMGLRLVGETLTFRGSPEIISDGMPDGAIQVPGHGQPIMMLAERGTTGGYPKIAVVISADLPLVAQLKAGDTVSFEAVDFDTARTALTTMEETLRKLETSPAIVTAPPAGEVFDVTVDGYHYKLTIKKCE
ncbi:MAG: biotin-dependent carboxyltransferase family protein [Firmicutes bacterium]|nr:biotin-dependent carboxyltransferase family protein [Bacillota bacterium]